MADGKQLQVQVIDTASWDEFPAMQSLFVKMSHLVLVVYDVKADKATERVLSLISEVRKIKGKMHFLVTLHKVQYFKSI